MQDRLIAPVVIGTSIGTLLVVALVLLKWRPTRIERIEGPPRYFPKLAPCSMPGMINTAAPEWKTLTRVVAFLDIEMQEFLEDSFGPKSSPIDAEELRATLQSWPFVADGRLPVDELVRLAKKRQATFIRHFLATEVFSIIEVDKNPDFTLLFRESVALQSALLRHVPQESQSQRVDLLHVLAHIRQALQVVSPPVYNKEGLLQFYKRIDSVLKPLITCSEQAYEAHRAKVAKCAQEVGRVFLSSGPLDRADWTMKEHVKDAVLVFPNVLVIKNDKGQPNDSPGNIIRVGTAQTPSKERMPAYPEGTQKIQTGDYWG
ncbi:hypothetical protein MMC30_007629 [Trapelia coarctata]|nr:hypothetical protein [Trapelia coarctata]